MKLNTNCYGLRSKIVPGRNNLRQVYGNWTDDRRTDQCLRKCFNLARGSSNVAQLNISIKQITNTLFSVSIVLNQY